MSTAVTITYLQMRARDELRRAPAPGLVDVLLRRAEVPCPALSRFLYTAVGGDWYWRDRLGWSQAQWREYLARPGVATWLLSVRGTPAGYLELERQEHDTEIAYFGLLPEFIGQGLGGWLLGEGIARAWDMDAPRRVWVHTCTLDGPAALPNYLARGMAIYREETRFIDDPGEADGPWPGANRRA
ncbi:MAG: cysE [Hydrocarboniphaga sp.]|uniref:GNAT family N-acetyltransferase n=1 Tax=Hydrocarboniphaga sp. TaxID=2033016 RepID=UPI002634F1C8|nr:GNAT family N-acetyltransferase [Hydrocarboniphaga sp.]MDB5969630.1 cysE [Hydrocarboniphaga sp.]